jgi:hypothetical protein
MPEFALAGAGAIVFALTTWASLAFGYQVFQTMWESDQADEPAPVRPEDEEVAIPVLAATGPRGVGDE